jgi:hypothetical protein
LPAAVGLGAASYHEPHQFNSGIHLATAGCAAVLMPAAVLAAVLVDNDVLRPGGRAISAPEGKSRSAVGALLLEPSPPVT